MLTQTPSQTVGPFFHDALLRGGESVLVTEQSHGRRICIRGQVLDGTGQPVPDALVEIWQADARGYFNHPADPNQAQADRSFRGFGRCGTADRGRFAFTTIKPGRLPDRAGIRQAPHINFRVFARGMLIHVLTRLYFADESANESDPVLLSIEPAGRRRTLIAVPEPSEELPAYCFDIHLQGEHETVFFE